MCPFKTTISKDYYTSIGMVASEWSYLEMSLEMSIWTLSELKPKYGNVITTNLNIGTLLKILDALIHDRFPDSDVESEFREFKGRINDMNQRRSKFVHARWVYKDGDSDAVLMNFKSGKRLKLQHEYFSSEQIEETATEIKNLRMEYGYFNQKYFAPLLKS